MSYEIQPADTGQEIAQNVRVITTTRRGTQPLDRELGIDGRYIDAAGTRGRALLAADILDTLPRQEPRVGVKSVDFTGQPDAGEYSPVIDYEVL